MTITKNQEDKKSRKKINKDALVYFATERYKKELYDQLADIQQCSIGEAIRRAMDVEIKKFGLL